MSLLVQKFGGTSIGTLERIQHVADKIALAHQAGHDLIIVVSAMSGETNRLVKLSQAISSQPDPREYASLVTTGEQVSIALLTTALLDRHVPAKSFLGSQVPIHTNSDYQEAKILSVETSKLRETVRTGQVAIVAGFQGCDRHGNITTLGRGGSDMTALLLAAALEADECQIYTDVEGIYSADPKLVSDAYCFRDIASQHLLTLSRLGAKVMQARAMEIAHEHNVPMRILSGFSDAPGTRVCYKLSKALPGMGLAHIANQSLINIPLHLAKELDFERVLSRLSQANVVLDLNVKHINDENESILQLSMPAEGLNRVEQVLSEGLPPSVFEARVVFSAVSKVSLVTHGLSGRLMDSQKVIKILTNSKICVHLCDVHPQHVSLLLPDTDLARGVNLLHQAFCQLNQGSVGGHEKNVSIFDAKSGKLSGT